MTADPFESPKLLLEEARENIRDLEARIKRLNDSHPYANVIDFDANTREKIHKIRLTQKLPGSIRTAASNALNNTRHALDQAVYSACRELKAKKLEATYFPFASSPDDLHRPKGVYATRCKDIPPGLHPILDGFQPYPTGNGYTGGDDVLRALGSVSGPNKHRLILDVRLHAGISDMHLRDVKAGPGGQGVSVMVPEWDPLKNELEVLRVGEGATFEGNYKIGILIGFADVPAFAGQPIAPLLSHLASKGDSIVLGLEAETARLVASGYVAP